ncbi:hypothetical protein D3C72_2515440 [compost metagenome]
MDKSVQNSISNGLFTNNVIPALHRDLRCYNDGSVVVTVFYDLQKGYPVGTVQSLKTKIIKDDHILSLYFCKFAQV